jgi:hypothetical protein
MLISFNRLCVVLLALVLASCSDPDQVPESHISAPPERASPAKSADVARYPLRQAFFGDLHVHTSWSTDAYMGGNRVGPNDAYRFARGEMIKLGNGVEAQLQTPLDFVALTDHAEGFDTIEACTLPDSPAFDTERCRTMRSGRFSQEDYLREAFESGITRPAQRDPDLCADLEKCLAYARSTWRGVQETANAFDDPGRFTTLIGYEFSALLPEFGMLHRNVIFRSDDVIPHAISSQDVRTQAELFARLDAACVEPCEVLTIPHNTNYSWGVTFSRTDEDGSSYTAEDLKRRARIERLFEVTQQKGNSECQIGVGASDEDCNYENLFPPCDEGQATQCVRPASFLRNALLDGLTIGQEDELNPFKVGAIGSTDTHQSDPGNTRNGPPSTFARAVGLSIGVKRVLELDHVVAGPLRRMTVGGLAGVWAEANTRADIFDALQRREAFATSGSRLRIRFFGGDLPSDISTRQDPVAIAYKQGVPMGADLLATTDPTFWVWAVQDPNGPALDRIQIIKGWIEGGEQRQKVWDVACSGDRVPDADGKCPLTMADVDIRTCEAVGEAGASELQIAFKDPDFSAGAPAFYYARVFEDPSCRWTTALANSGEVKPPTDVPATVQERGWSSPIWVSSR